MAPRVTKDPAHPDFPHGDSRGYSRGCRERCCVTARTRMAKRYLHTRHTGGEVTMPAQPVRDHLVALIAHEGVTWAGIGRAAPSARLSKDRVRQIAEGTAKTIVRRQGVPLMRVTADSARAQGVRRGHVDKTETVRLIRCLQAQGWPLGWMSAELGYVAGYASVIASSSPNTMVTEAVAARFRELADRVGDRRGPSPRAAQCARRLGFYPLIAYDDDGVLHREWLADGSGGSRGTAHRETLSGDWLRCLSLSLAGKSLTDIAGITGLSERTVQRARERVGIRFAVSDEWGTTVPALGQVAEVRAARAALADWDGGGVDARTAWKALMRAVAAARAGDAAAVDDEAA